MSAVIDAPATPAIICAACNRSRATKKTVSDGTRLPPGWKREPSGEPVCDQCWHGRYIMRAVQVPIATIVGVEHADLKAAWRELRQSLRDGWTACQRVANWALAELAKAEPPPEPGATKMPPYEWPYLYGMGKPWDRWGLTATTANAVLRFAQSRYRADRLECWRGKRSIASVRNAPLPLNSQSVRLGKSDQGGTLFNFAVGSRRWTVLLRGGHRWRRTYEALRPLIDSPHLIGECAVLDHGKDVTVKIAAWFPRRAAPKSGDGPQRTFSLATAPTAFWLGSIGDRDWILNADHVRGWNAQHNRVKVAGARHRANVGQTGMMEPERLRQLIGEHDDAVQRLREDAKREKRRPSTAQELMTARMAAMTAKHQARMTTWCQQAAAMAVGFAARNKCGTIAYNDACQDFMPHFPWHKLRTCLANKCDEAGIRLELSSGESARERPDPLESTEGV